MMEETTTLEAAELPTKKSHVSAFMDPEGPAGYLGFRDALFSKEKRAVAAQAPPSRSRAPVAQYPCPSALISDAPFRWLCALQWCGFHLHDFRRPRRRQRLRYE